MEYSPPPLFKQGASARAKMLFFAVAAIVLLVVDSRVRSLDSIRQAIGTGLYPVQKVVLLPRDAIGAVSEYFTSLSRLQSENEQLKRQHLQNAQMLMQMHYLMAENQQLRKVLDAAERLPVRSVMTEVLYDARDAYTRKVVLDRGSRHGIATGHPVIDDDGVIGQVTRVFPFTAEVTLLTDKNQAISVQVLRNGVRSIAYGRGQAGALELRFVTSDTDIREGDILVTSGIDGVFPAGLPVARVTEVELKSSGSFVRILCQPIGGVDRNKQFLVLLPEGRSPAAAVNETLAPEETAQDATLTKQKNLQQDPTAQ